MTPQPAALSQHSGGGFSCLQSPVHIAQLLALSATLFAAGFKPGSHHAHTGARGHTQFDSWSGFCAVNYQQALALLLPASRLDVLFTGECQPA